MFRLKFPRRRRDTTPASSWNVSFILASFHTTTGHRHQTKCKTPACLMRSVADTSKDRADLANPLEVECAVSVARNSAGVIVQHADLFPFEEVGSGKTPSGRQQLRCRITTWKPSAARQHQRLCLRSWTEHSQSLGARGLCDRARSNDSGPYQRWKECPEPVSVWPCGLEDFVLGTVFGNRPFFLQSVTAPVACAVDVFLFRRRQSGVALRFCFEAKYVVSASSVCVRGRDCCSPRIRSGSAGQEEFISVAESRRTFDTTSQSWMVSTAALETYENHARQVFQEACACTQAVCANTDSFSGWRARPASRDVACGAGPVVSLIASCSRPSSAKGGPPEPHPQLPRGFTLNVAQQFSHLGRWREFHSGILDRWSHSQLVTRTLPQMGLSCWPTLWIHSKAPPHQVQPNDTFELATRPCLWWRLESTTEVDGSCSFPGSVLGIRTRTRASVSSAINRALMHISRARVCSRLFVSSTFCKAPCLWLRGWGARVAIARHDLGSAFVQHRAWRTEGQTASSEDPPSLLRRTIRKATAPQENRAVISHVHDRGAITSPFHQKMGHCHKSMSTLRIGTDVWRIQTPWDELQRHAESEQTEFKLDDPSWRGFWLWSPTLSKTCWRICTLESSGASSSSSTSSPWAFSVLDSSRAGHDSVPGCWRRVVRNVTQNQIFHQVMLVGTASLHVLSVVHLAPTWSIRHHHVSMRQCGEELVNGQADEMVQDLYSQLTHRDGKLGLRTRYEEAVRTNCWREAQVTVPRTTELLVFDPCSLLV